MMDRYSLRWWENMLFGFALGCLTYWTIGCETPLPDHPEVMDACPESLVVLERFGCEDAVRSDYIDECEHISNLGYIWTDDKSGPLCVARARTKAEVRACSVMCP
jgi:hypothetical protein